MKVFSKHSFATAFLLSATTPTFAQSNGLVASPPETRQMFSSDLERLVDATFPVYDEMTLGARLTQAAAALQGRADRVTVRSLSGIERLMGLSPTTAGGSEVDTAVAYYRLDERAGKAYAHLKQDSYVGMPAERFATIEGALRLKQQQFFGSLGLPSDELMKSVSHKVMMQSLLEGSPDNSDGSPALVRRGFATVYRGLGGFPVDGSMARASSLDGSRIDTFSLIWPKFKLHPQVTAVNLDRGATVKSEILRQLKVSTVAGDEIALSMGVVFQPVHTLPGELVFVPAMKVVITPKAKAVADNADRTQTDGGRVFYARLLRVSPQVQSEDVVDR